MRCRVSSRCGRGVPHGLEDGRGRVQRLVLLGVVADDGAMPGRDLSGVGGVDPREDAQQRRLARSVEAEDHDPAPPVDGEVDVGEHLQRAVRAGEPGGHQGNPAARLGLGEAQGGHLVAAAHLVARRHDLVRALEHRLRSLGLGGLGAHLLRLAAQRIGLLLGVAPLAATPSLVRLPGGQVGLPAHRVEVDLTTVGVEVPDLVHGVLQQFGVMADDDEAALVRRQELAQPPHGVGVEVVGGLVEQEDVGPAEQDARELDAPALAAGQGAERLVEDPLHAARRWPRSPRPGTPRRSLRAPRTRPRHGRSGRSGGRAPPRPWCPSPCWSPACAARRRAGRVPRGCGRGRSRRGCPSADPAAGSPRSRSRSPDRRRASSPGRGCA